MLSSNVDLCKLIWWALIGLFRLRVALVAENLALRQQINVLRRTGPKRPRFGNIDRLIFVGLSRAVSTARDALAIVQPATVIRWHRAGFRAYWRWKSRARRGRPTVPLEVRRLIRTMSLANPLWGAPRMHGELLKLGIDVGQTSVTKYMARRRRPPSQGWRTFLRNHADGIVAMDLFVVPTISFQLLYGLLILCHDRRRVLWMGVTAHPTAEWIARRLTEACGWDQAPNIPAARSRSGLWSGFHPACSCHGHSRSPDFAAVAMAKCLCRAADRLNPTGMHRSYCGLRRTAPSSRVAVVHELLQ